MSNVLLEVRDRIALLTINRPEKLNALNKDTILELKNTIEEIEQNNEIACVIVTGSGEKAICCWG